MRYRSFVQLVLWSCVLVLCWGRASVRAATVQLFDGATATNPCAIGTPCSIASCVATPPSVTTPAGGPIGIGKFLRLATTTPIPNQNTLAFPRTDSASPQIVIDFDYRLIPPKVERADGFGVVLLNTAHYGTTGPVCPIHPPFAMEDPNFIASLGVGFDLYKSTGDINNNHLSVHFNRQVIKQVDITPIMDLANGQWTHVRLILHPNQMTKGPGEVTVILTPQGREPITVINRLPVPGFEPYQGRMLFGARSGGLSVFHDLDNINVQFLPLLPRPKDILSFKAVSYTGIEGQSVKITVLRTGLRTGTGTVRVSTRNGTALANSDYTPTSRILTFGPGVSSLSFDILLPNDTITEPPPDKTFGVDLSSPTGDAVIGGPANAGVFITDDDLARSLGHWDEVLVWPIIPIHSHLLPTGAVLFWDSKGESWLWHPITRELKRAAQAGHNIFCSGHSFLSDGRLLVTGGDVKDNVGLNKVSIYNPFLNTWTPLGALMNAGRWYPTNTTLPNGDVVVTSGDITPNNVNRLPQVWHPANGTWRNLTTALRSLPLYPFMYVAPNGKVFNAGPNPDTRYLTTTGTGRWEEPPFPNTFGFRGDGSSVMFAPGKIMNIGGDLDGSGPQLPTATAEVVDLTAATPTWRRTGSMVFARKYHNAVLLPDGTVVAVGGARSAGFNDAIGAVLPAELWSPTTGLWRTLAAIKVPRLYHSTAILLPDSRVLAAGGGEPGASNSFDHRDAELYSPSYLFKGPRPVISAVPAAVSYNASFLVRTPDVNSVARVSIVRLPSVTHAFDQNQRFNNLAFVKVVGGAQVTAPAAAALAPPGHYMLFLLNANGVPSVARIIALR